VTSPCDTPYPCKERPENEVGGAIALIMAIARHKLAETKKAY